MPIIRQTPPRVAPTVIQRQDSRELRARFPRLAPDAEKQRRLQPSVVTTNPAAPSAVIKPSTPSASRHNNEGQLHPTQPQPALNPPERREQRPFPGQTKEHASPAAPPRPGDASGQGIKPRELKQKKVWKVITTEQGNEKNQRDKENKDNRGRK